ncbi:MAG: hypothetical protein ABIK44_07905 [candidate division WOR-3 bacterium]
MKDKNRMSGPGFEERVERRIERFLAKTRPSRLARVAYRLRPEMVARFAFQARMLEAVEAAVRKTIDRHGVLQITRPAYLAFGREVYGLWRRYSGVTLERELAIARNKWACRSLEPWLLEQVQAAVLAAAEAEPAEPKP